MPSIKILREAGLDFRSIQEDSSGISDMQVMAVAQQDNLIILTLDKDYGEIIYHHRITNPPAVVFFRSKGDHPKFAANQLLQLLDDGITFADRFTVIDETSLRQRLLK